MDKKNVEDLYPLSPTQQGMLFHSLYDPESGAYIEQMVCNLYGDLDIPAFARAWQHVLDRHPVLRTAFVGEGLKEPAQVVFRKAQLSLERQDWRGLSPAEQTARFETFLQADRTRGFELAKAPLLRLALIQVADAGYTFVWTYHHILLDGWSIPLLFREVFAFYAAFHTGEDLRLDLPRPYRDYIVWLRQHALTDAESFWRRTLQGFASPTPLMTYRPPGDAADREERHAALKIRLSTELTTALAALAQQLHMTVSTLVQAAWGLLLSRYSGETDVVFGVAVSGRPADMLGVESMIGMFLNTLPMRVRVPANISLLAWLNEVRALQIEMQQYEYSPLVEVQGWSQVPRGTPLFESLLVFQGHLIDDSLLGRHGSVEIRDVHFVEAVNYSLVVDILLGATPALNVLYSSPRFDADTIGRMLEHFQILLEGMTTNPQRPLSDLPLLSERERQQLLKAWNTTRTDVPLDQCFSQLFETQVERTPDAIAAACDAVQISYRQLNRRANQLAAHLIEHAIPPDTVVALLAERGLDFLSAMLAVFKAGAAYLPLDPRYPVPRLRQVLQQSRSPLVLCADALMPLLADTLDGLPGAERPEILCLTEVWQAECPAPNPPLRSTPRQLAYVIYTSGSTGVPKGALLEQRGMLNHLSAKIHALQLTAGDRIAQTAPQSFDISVWQFLAGLLVGGCVQIVPDEVAFDPTRLLAEVCNHHVTIWETVPSLLQAMLDVAFAQPEANRLTALRWLMPTGEVLPPDLARHWLKVYPNTPLINAYGPTECSDDVTHYPITALPDIELARIPIGRPVANLRLYVLAAQGQLAPLGVAGELYVGGVGVGRGYLHEPLKTAQAFVPDPFSAELGERMYKTGDLACWRTDGQLEFLGRIDRQVKVRGYRIELGEVESVLRQHAQVREAVVEVREERLVGYVVARDGAELATSALRQFLQQRLPEYMVPATFVVLDSLPLTPNGKVDRRVLPAPDGTRPKLENTFVLPRTPTEEALVQIWAQVLGLERVGIHDDFFGLGGHSLLVAQVVSRVRQTFQVELPLRVLFEARTVADLAKGIETVHRVVQDSRVSTPEGEQEEWVL